MYKKHIIKLFLPFIVLVFFASFSFSQDPVSSFGEKNIKALKAVQNAVNQNPKNAKTLPQREWLIMLYMNAKNGKLPGMAKEQLNKAFSVNTGDKILIMAKAGLPKNKAALAGFNGENSPLSLSEGGKENYTYAYISEDADAEMEGILPAPFYRGPAEDFGSYKTLAQFVKASKNNYPAQKYMLIIWGHGLGAGGISPDEDYESVISALQIGAALKAAGGVDVLAFNAPFMQTAEVIYPLLNYASFIVGPQDAMPQQGYNLAKLFEHLLKNPGEKPEKAAEVLVKNTLKNAGSDAAFAGISSAFARAFYTVLGEWAKNITESRDKTSADRIIKNAAQTVFRFNQNDSCATAADLRMLADTFRSQSSDRGIRDISYALLQLLDAKGGLFFYKDGQVKNKKGASVKPGGLSIGMPNAKCDSGVTPYREYEQSALSSAEHMGQFYARMRQVIKGEK